MDAAERSDVVGALKWFTIHAALAVTMLLGYVFFTYEPPVASLPEVNIRWAPGTASEQRQILERQFQVVPLEYLGSGPDDTTPNGRTWRYQILDTSRNNVRSIVEAPPVEDTHNIDRNRFRVLSISAPGWLALPPGSGLAILGGLLIGAFAAPFSLARAPRVAAMLTRGVPDLSAGAMGLFRVALAAFVAIALSRERIPLADRVVEANRELSWWWLDWLLARPAAVATLETALLVLLGVFAVGLATRWVYAAFVLGLSVWLAVLTQLGTNIHHWEATWLLTLCLLPVPWGDGFSLDEMIRRWRGAPPRRGAHGMRYGFAVWVPGFVLGAIWVGAAYSKLEQSGVAWITGGAVRYHWVIDSFQAPVSLGLWVATHEWAAVLASFLGVALEAIFIMAVFARTARARTTLGLVLGLPLLGGFFLFHGLLWWTWWLVLLSFVLPWEGIHRVLSSRLQTKNESADSAPRTRGLHPAYGLIVLGVCVLMLRQWPEGVGRFTSYSNTYASTEDFDLRNPIKPIRTAWVDYGTPDAREVTGRVGSPLLMDAIAILANGEVLSTSQLRDLQEIYQAWMEREQKSDFALTLIEERRTFDWDQSRFTPPSLIVVGTMDVATAQLTSAN